MKLLSVEYYVKDGMLQRNPSQDPTAAATQQDTGRDSKMIMGFLALDAIVFVYTLVADAKVRRQIRDVHMSMPTTPGVAMRETAERRRRQYVGKLLFRFLMIHIFVNAIPFSIVLLFVNQLPVQLSTFVSFIAVCNTLTHCLMLPVLSLRFRRRLVQNLWRCTGRKVAASQIAGSSSAVVGST